MKRFTQPWRPCRNLGTQPAGNAACSPRPEVVIADPVTTAPSPRWTFRGKGGATMPTCRPADLPTCRPADLPTCRPAVWGVDDRWGDTACSLNACLGAGVPALFNSEVEDFAASSASSNCPNVSSGVVVSLHLPPVKAPLPTGNSEEPICS
jgi:hypothetical protein